MTPFVIFALPRSRTAWLSNFLSYGDWSCAHESARHWRSMADGEAWFSQPCTGTIETALAPFWRSLPEGIRAAVVRRPAADVIESLMAVPGCAFDRPALEQLIAKHDRKLDQIEKRLAPLTIGFDELQTEQGCARLFEYCLPYKHDATHWRALAPVNIQINMPALMRYFQAFLPALEKLAAVAKGQTLRNMALRSPVPPDGVTLQEEGFDTWLKDAGHLFDQHLIKVGEAPGDWERKNIPLMRAMHEMGAMQIVTARSNGRMFGYLMTVIAPSLASPDLVSAVNTTFFASNEYSGLGLKLQRAALEGLKKKGVGEVFMRAGVRGEGDRLDTIFRRIGAESNGREYRLVL